MCYLLTLINFNLRKVLNFILTSSDMDETCTQIQEYLCSMHEQMQTMSIPLKNIKLQNN